MDLEPCERIEHHRTHLCSKLETLRDMRQYETCAAPRGFHVLSVWFPGAGSRSIVSSGNMGWGWLGVFWPSNCSDLSSTLSSQESTHYILVQVQFKVAASCLAGIQLFSDWLWYSTSVGQEAVFGLRGYQFIHVYPIVWAILGIYHLGSLITIYIEICAELLGKLLCKDLLAYSNLTRDWSQHLMN